MSGPGRYLSLPSASRGEVVELFVRGAWRPAMVSRVLRAGSAAEPRSVVDVVWFDAALSPPAQPYRAALQLSPDDEPAEGSWRPL